MGQLPLTKMSVKRKVDRPVDTPIPEVSSQYEEILVIKRYHLKPR